MAPPGTVCGSPLTLICNSVLAVWLGTALNLFLRGFIRWPERTRAPGRLPPT